MGGIAKTVLKPIGGVLGALVPKAKKPDLPDIPEATVMPVADDLERKKALRRAVAMKMKTGSSIATDLTGSGTAKKFGG